MNDIKNILEQKGLKVTKSRVATLETLMSSMKPLDIESIFSMLPIKINKTTLYRILHTYADMGIVYQTDFRDGKAYFEFQDTHHHHIVCTKCGKKEGVSHCDVSEDIRTVASTSSSFNSINAHSLEFFGICNDCV
jgi:Fe2+ or Zn2+ uptake regulation protein